MDQYRQTSDGHLMQGFFNVSTAMRLKKAAIGALHVTRPFAVVHTDKRAPVRKRIPVAPEEMHWPMF